MNFLVAKFEKWAHLWCQHIIKSDPLIGIDFNSMNDRSTPKQKNRKIQHHYYGALKGINYSKKIILMLGVQFMVTEDKQDST